MSEDRDSAPPLPVTPDTADFALLGLANEKGKFAIQLGLALEPTLQAAFERGIERDWFTFVDLARIETNGPGGPLMRVFRLTARGRSRHAELSVQFLEHPPAAKDS